MKQTSISSTSNPHGGVTRPAVGLTTPQPEKSSSPATPEGSGGPTPAAPSKSRVIKRPGARVSYANLNRVILKQLYRKTELARTLGWSVTTFERVADGLGIKPTYGVNRDRYLGRNVVAALEGGSR